jgi:hypothetical protein
MSGLKLAWRRQSVSVLNELQINDNILFDDFLHPSRRMVKPSKLSLTPIFDERLNYFVSGTAILFVKAYVELYAGKLHKQKISYKEFPQSTHAVMALILASSVAFHLSLWPVFGSASMLIMFLVGMFILNFCLLMPTYVQNLVAFALLTFFIQEYS